jgi:hypothetical protein
MENSEKFTKASGATNTSSRLEQFNQRLASVNPEAPPEAHIVDWSAFWPEVGPSHEAEQISASS